MLDGTKPSYFYPFINNFHYQKKVSKLASWLDMPFTHRPHLITAYAPEVDQEGHRSGPHSHRVEESLSAMDDFAKEVYELLEARNLTEVVDVIFVSDHGMTGESPVRDPPITRSDRSPAQTRTTSASSSSTTFSARKASTASSATKAGHPPACALPRTSTPTSCSPNCRTPRHPVGAGSRSSPMRPCPSDGTLVDTRGLLPSTRCPSRGGPSRIDMTFMSQWVGTMCPRGIMGMILLV